MLLRTKLPQYQEELSPPDDMMELKDLNLLVTPHFWTNPPSN